MPQICLANKIMNNAMTENQKFQMILDSMKRIEDRLDDHIKYVQVQLTQIRDGMISTRIRLGVIYGVTVIIAGSVAWLTRLR